MDFEVHFKHGQQANLPAQRDSRTFYYTDDGEQLYIGRVLLSNANDVAAAMAQLVQDEADILALQGAVNTLNGDVLVPGSVRYLIAEGFNGLADIAATGKAEDVSIDDGAEKFTATNVEDALAELATAIESFDGGGAVTVTVASTPTEGYVKTYNINQNGSVVGVIDIPKDLVVQSGTVETVTVADEPYTGAVVGDKYIDLVIQNQTNHLFIPVNSLVDIYTVTANAPQVQLAISPNNEISASIVAGSIGTAEIADGAVTKAKLSQAVQNLIDGKVDEEVTGTNGSAYVFNEADGGGAKFEHKDGTWSFVGVNDGGASGLTGQIYSVDKDSLTGTRINMTSNGFFYTSGKSNSQYTADDEIATKSDVDSARLIWETF
jgi:hypothetical protein